MYIFLLVIHIITCLVLILVILLQSGKGGGVSEMFGGSAMQDAFGTKVSSFLTKATTVCASLFLVTCLLLAVIASHQGKSLIEKEFIKQKRAAPAGKATVRKVQIDPKSGKETLVEEKQVEQTQLPPVEPQEPPTE